MSTLPIVDLDLFLHGEPGARAAEAKKTAEALIKYGALVVKDSRVSEQDNSTFLDLLENYFAQPDEVLRKDIRPEYGYQVGATLENTEKPRCSLDTDCHELIASLDASERPLDLTGEFKDPKCRFFWRMNKNELDELPAESNDLKDQLEGDANKFAILKAPNVLPAAFPDWKGKMEQWGNQMLSAVDDVNGMLAVGLGLPENSLKNLARNGSHLLAPTSTNLEKYGRKGDIFAGFHSDLNYLTIHGRSRYPGLHIWARNSGQRIQVSMPPGHLLVQAGKQLEHLTGGLILAGFHEVVCTDGTIAAIERIKREAPERPLYRISSTFFYHLSPQEFIEPLKELESQRQATISSDRKPVHYEGMCVGELVQRELQHIKLMA